MKRPNRIAIITPMPPPVHGQSLAGAMLVEELAATNRLIVIDSALDKNFTGNKLPSIFSVKRLFTIFYRLTLDSCKLLFNRFDVLYMSVGITYRGFMRFVPYMLLAMAKSRPYVIHTHGSTFSKEYCSLSPFKQRVLRYFMGHAAKVVVLGQSLVDTVTDMADITKVAVCNNGVPKEFFATSKEIEYKYGVDTEQNINILFLSNLMEAKGIIELLAAFRLLPNNFTLHLAGAIEPSAKVEEALKQALIDFPRRIIHHGVADGNNKRNLLIEGDIVVLPSKNEGQPLVILEAYAAASAVVTDAKVGGISDIFEHHKNGVSCNHSSPESIAGAILECSKNIEEYIKYNTKISSQFSQELFAKRIEAILNNVITASHHKNRIK